MGTLVRHHGPWRLAAWFCLLRLPPQVHRGRGHGCRAPRWLGAGAGAARRGSASCRPRAACVEGAVVCQSDGRGLPGRHSHSAEPPGGQHHSGTARRRWRRGRGGGVARLPRNFLGSSRSVALRSHKGPQNLVPRREARDHAEVVAELQERCKLHGGAVGEAAFIGAIVIEELLKETPVLLHKLQHLGLHQHAADPAVPLPGCLVDATAAAAACPGRLLAKALGLNQR
mmetsp:Transcript_20406/g.51412  ORF Transcript_20406/g.51412 Transcript_20406/m.51412 type:complete len:228 (-) Transcript_20406:1222-1905(-)